MRRERGPAPDDLHDFSADALAGLRHAVSDLSWLLSHGYPDAASLKLVGDRYALRARQRKAVQRSSCSNESLAKRRMKVGNENEGEALHIDGFNCIIMTESLLSGAPVFRGRDGVLRDLAGVQGTWRRLEVTDRALEILSMVLRERMGRICWWLDRPVSNSGRLKQLLLEVGNRKGLVWDVEVVADPDGALMQRDGVIATADGRILDACKAWVDLPGKVASQYDGWVIDLGTREDCKNSSMSHG